MSQPFTRRMYRRPAQLFEDVRTVLSARGQIRALMQGQTISAAFRERLMLAVSAVNGCRYCSFVHAQQALKAGLSDPEVRALCAGSLGGCPEEELPALLYAQHWAETEGQPDPEVRAQVWGRYGRETAQAIDASLTLIQAANLMGNTFDYLLYRASFGRWAGGRPRGMERAGVRHE